MLWVKERPLLHLLAIVPNIPLRIDPSWDPSSPPSGPDCRGLLEICNMHWVYFSWNALRSSTANRLLSWQGVQMSVWWQKKLLSQHSCSRKNMWMRPHSPVWAHWVAGLQCSLCSTHLGRSEEEGNNQMGEGTWAKSFLLLLGQGKTGKEA